MAAFISCPQCGAAAELVRGAVNEPVMVSDRERRHGRRSRPAVFYACTACEWCAEWSDTIAAAAPTALDDAIATARVRIAEERRAIALCDERGYDTDGAVARRELRHHEALLARLLDRRGKEGA